MINPTPIKLVIFDLGRVLVRICDNWAHACEVAHLPIKLQEIDPDTRAAISTQVHHHEKNLQTKQDFAQNVAKLLKIDAQQVEQMLDVYLLKAYEDGPALLDEIRARGIKTACLSNTNADHWNAMCDPKNACHVPLHDLDYRFASQEIGHRKPEPEIYEYVERETGLSGNQIVFFDDLIENVKAATARGWHAFQIFPTSDPIAQARQHLLRLGALSD